MRALALALAAILSPFLVLHWYIILVFPTRFNASHPQVIFWLGLVLALAIGLAFLWPLRKGLNLFSIVFLTVAYLVVLTPCLIFLALDTVCKVTGNQCI